MYTHKIDYLKPRESFKKKGTYWQEVTGRGPGVGGAHVFRQKTIFLNTYQAVTVPAPNSEIVHKWSWKEVLQKF